MIINGGSRSNGAFFARHLTRTDENERVAVAEIRGLAAQTVRDAFREMRLVASGTRCTNYFYHANLNPREGERLTPEQWQAAADLLERALGLTDQPRLIIEHEKGGRTHRHVVWSRIDADSMTAISDSLTYQKHERAARELEQLFGHDTLDSVLVKDREKERPERNPQDWESFRGQESKRDPKSVKAEVTALWQVADSGPAFAAALREHGYILARGDRREFCIIDPAGDEHSLARRIGGVKAADIRARMADIDPAALPSVAEGRALARERLETTHHGLVTPEPQAPAPADGGSVSIGMTSLASQGTPVAGPEPLARDVGAPGGGGLLMRALRGFFRDATPELFELPVTATTGPPFVAPVVSHAPPLTAREAEWQVRQAAAQFIIREVASGAPGDANPPASIHTHALPRFGPPADAAMAGEHVRAVAALFVEAIEHVGSLPGIVADLVDDGLQWFHRAAHYLAELAEDARDTVHGIVHDIVHDTVLTWRDYARMEREERDRDDDELDFD